MLQLLFQVFISLTPFYGDRSKKQDHFIFLLNGWTSLFDQSPCAMVKMTLDYACTEAKLMTLVSTYGAAVSYINASDSAFANYARGIFNQCTSQNVNHAILVVGYGTDNATGLDYWLIKNSWGTRWGNNGFIQIQRGNNQCGIGRFCYAAQCGKTNGTISDPPIAPPPPPIPSETCDVSGYYGKKLNGSGIKITWGCKLTNHLI